MMLPDRLWAQMCVYKGHSSTCGCIEHTGKKVSLDEPNYVAMEAAKGNSGAASVMEGSRVFL